MVTLNGLAEVIAFKLREQYNDTLKESIKTDFIDYRSLFIRRDLERNPMSYLDFLQTVCVEMEEADSSYCVGLPSGCTVLKSKQVLAKPIRLKSNGRSNFTFVGTVDKGISFSFTTQHEMQYNCSLPLQSNTIYYGYMNGYLIIYNNPLICKVLLEYIPVDPRDIDDCDFPDVFPDDREFNLPSDMVAEIKNLIIREYQPPIENGEQVNIEKHD